VRLESAQEHRAVAERHQLWRLQRRQKFRVTPRAGAQARNGAQLRALQHGLHRKLALDAVGMLGARRVAPALAQRIDAHSHASIVAGGIAARNACAIMWKSRA